MTENQIEQAILRYLNKNSVFAFKFKDNTRSDSGRHMKPTPFQINGVSDICVVLRGITYWIEIKTSVGKQSSAQKLFQKKIEENGGAYLLWRSIDEAKEFVATHPPQQTHL